MIYDLYFNIAISAFGGVFKDYAHIRRLRFTHYQNHKWK